MRRTEQANSAAEYIRSFIGLPYRWGGDDPLGGFDCSGLAIEMLKSVGIMEPHWDTTADGLMHIFPIVESPEVGCLVLFGKDGRASHVGIMVNSEQMIEAGGGGSSTLTEKDAEKQNAFVRVRPIKARRDFLCFADPFLVE